jgi:folate-dependent phosphoribosylglycinamide formyltransferase PurN
MLIFDPARPGSRMTIVCFVSGSGTNYREIVKRDPSQHYLVFTNRPGCGGAGLARANGHPVIELSHSPFLKEAKQCYGAGKVPRNCPERVRYEQEISRLIQSALHREPDLICLAGYDQWLTDWLVDRYYSRILNVHPGDTTRGYDGLHWIPSARAILAGDEAVRSTLFFVDKGEDSGPVLLQSAPLNILRTLREAESAGSPGFTLKLRQISAFAAERTIDSYETFRTIAGATLNEALAQVSATLQEALKVHGDWQIYPVAVHDLIGRGRVELAGCTVYLDGQALPEYGGRLDQGPNL